MPVDEITLTALDLKNLRLPPRPPVIAVEVEDYVDTTGEEALRVWVILDESTQDSDLNGDAVIQLKRTIRDALLGRGVEKFPYVFLTKRSEREASDEE